MSNTALPIRTAICYLRRSREDEEAERRGEDTLQKQREWMIREVLAHQNFDYDIAEEVASGDSIQHRPVFRALLPQLGDKYQAIVCKDLSRLGRGSYGDMGLVYDILRDRRIFIITKDAVYDPANFSDLRMIRFSLFFNREEYEMTVWRLTEGKYDGASRGKWVAGSVPYGYRYHRNLQILVPHEEEAAVVRNLFVWFAHEQLTVQAISRRLAGEGILSPRGKPTWRTTVIRRILENPAYHGTLVFRKTRRNKTDGRVTVRPSGERIVVEHAFQPLVDDEIWLLVQNRLATRDARQGPRQAAERARRSWELAGLVTCAACNQTLVRQSSRPSYLRKNGERSTYTKEFLYCRQCGQSVKYRTCEDQLIQVLAHLKFATLGMFREAVENAEETRIRVAKVSVEEERDRQKRQLARWERRMEEARTLLLDGILSREEYLLVRRNTSAEIEKIQADLAKVEHDAPDDHNHDVRTSCRVTPRSIPDMDSLADLYRHLGDAALKNRLLHAVLHRVRLEVTEKGGGRNRPSTFHLDVELRSAASQHTPASTT